MPHPFSRLAYAQSTTLLAGTLWAWGNTIRDLIRFYIFEGTLLKITNCVIPNPFTQPCLYGALGFLAAFVWSLIILRRNTGRGQVPLTFFLYGGTIFAWANVAREFATFYASAPGTAVGCSGTAITNPFLTPCFVGATLFLLSAAIASFIPSPRSHHGQ